MFLFVGVIIVVWLSALTVWWLLSSFLRSSDFSKVKDRLAGGSKAKKAKTGPVQKKQLLQSDLQAITGVLPNLFKRYNLLPKLNGLIEQAGLRWSPIRTVHLCLALFIAGSGLAGCFFRPNSGRCL